MKALVGLLALVLIFFLVWLFWPQRLAKSIPEPPEPISAFSFTDTLPPPPSSPVRAQLSESLPKTIPSVPTSGRNFDVPHGAILPAMLLDNGSSDENKIADRLLVSLEEEFFKELQEAKSKGGATQEIWEELRSKYDERYIALFGQDAYLEATNLAAEEAREDFKTPATPR